MAYLALRSIGWPTTVTICHWMVARPVRKRTFSAVRSPDHLGLRRGESDRRHHWGLPGALEWIARVIEHACWDRSAFASLRMVLCISRCGACTWTGYDAIVTDPPYYDAIPYSDLMDFFYVWLRRQRSASLPEMDDGFSSSLGAEVGFDGQDGELIDDAEPIRRRQAEVLELLTRTGCYARSPCGGSSRPRRKTHHRVRPQDTRMRGRHWSTPSSVRASW